MSSGALTLTGWLAACGTNSGSGNPALGTGGPSTGGVSGSTGQGGSLGGVDAGGLGGSSGSAGSLATGGSSGGGAGGTTTAGSSGSGGGGTGGSAGSGEPADPVFTPNIRLNDDSGNMRQSEVTMASGPNGLVMAGWMDERAERVCAFSFSTDNGTTWSDNVSIEVTAGGFVGDPAVGIDGGGTLYAGCMDYGQDQIKLMTSSDKGQNWTNPTLIQDAPDKPWLGGGVTDGVVFVSWLGNQAGIKRSTDHGLTWGQIHPLGNIIHGTAIVTSTSGLVHVPYNLDSDNNQLRYLRSQNNGDSWDNTRDLVQNMGQFGFNDTPRQHPIVGAGADPNGEHACITWSSRMQGGENEEDVWLLYSDDGGDNWTDPIRVNDNNDNTRQFQAWCAVDAHGRVHVAWTDLRDDGLNKTYYARSNDPRQGFEFNMEVTDDRGSADYEFLGDYKGIVVSGPDVLIVWQDTRNDIGDIYFSKAPGAAGP